MSVGVLGKVNQQSDNGAWKFLSANLSGVVKSAGIERAEEVFRVAQAFIDQPQQGVYRQVRRALLLQESELRRRQLSVQQVGGDPVHAARQMLQMKADRSPVNLPPDLRIAQAGRMSSQVLSHLREAEKQRHHKRMNAFERTSQPRLGSAHAYSLKTRFDGKCSPKVAGVAQRVPPGLRINAETVWLPPNRYARFQIAVGGVE